MSILSGYALGEITAIIIFFIGVYGIIARRNIVKTVIAFGVMEMGVILFFLSNGEGSLKAPILADTTDIVAVSASIQTYIEGLAAIETAKSIDSEITSSPTKLMMVSSFESSTRISWRTIDFRFFF